MQRILIVCAALLGLAASLATQNDVTCSWQNCNEDCGGGKRRCDRSNGKTWNIDCHVQNCGDIEGCGRADIVFVFDSSASLGEKNWWIIKQFAIDIVKGIAVSYNESRVSAVSYSRNAITHWELGAYHSPEEVEDKLWELDWMSSTTNTHEGLLHAETVIANTARGDVKNMVIVITDGVSNINAHLTVPQAEIMHQEGIEIFCIGVGNIDEAEIIGIASEPKDFHAHIVAGFDALVAITNTVINDTCESADRVECEEWSVWGPCVADDPRNCGTGNHIRQRVCRFWNGPDEPVIIRIAKEYNPCEKDLCPPSVCVWTKCDAECGGTGFRTVVCSDGYTWTMPCRAQDCEPTPCGEADIVFVLDSSNSIGTRNWWRTLQFVEDVSRGLPEDDVRIGMVTFSATDQFQWGLKDSDGWSYEEFEDNVWDLKWLQSVTNTQAALKTGRQIYLDEARDVKKIMVVVTDGESNVHPENTIPYANLIKDDDVDIFTICVRDSTSGSQECEDIASDPKDLFSHKLNDYEALTAITQTVIEGACMAIRGLLK